MLLRYIVDKHYQVGELHLKPGDITIGAYWPDRPCTLYQWYDTDGNPIGDYFNIADQIEISDNQVVWRDLVLDVLILPGKSPKILDGQEIPRNCTEHTLGKIYLSKQFIMENYPEMIDEVREFVNMNQERIFNNQVKE